MRTVLVILMLMVATPFYAAVIVGSSVLRLPGRFKGVYRWGPPGYCTSLVRAAGVTVVTHGFEQLQGPDGRVLIANHVSWYDVPTLASVLPRFTFIAKAELRRVPLFGRAAAESGTMFIKRGNRKAAFAEYEKAAERIREGALVVIFPEGTRGRDYALRPFKKGPFVLAIASGAPIVPVLIHGTIEVLPKDSFNVRKHTVHIHALDPIPTAGLSYDDRDKLAGRVHDALRVAQQKLYGIESPKWIPARDRSLHESQV